LKKKRQRSSVIFFCFFFSFVPHVWKAFILYWKQGYVLFMQEQTQPRASVRVRRPSATQILHEQTEAAFAGGRKRGGSASRGELPDSRINTKRAKKNSRSRLEENSEEDQEDQEEASEEEGAEDIAETTRDFVGAPATLLSSFDGIVEERRSRYYGTVSKCAAKLTGRMAIQQSIIMAMSSFSR